MFQYYKILKSDFAFDERLRRSIIRLAFIADAIKSLATILAFSVLVAVLVRLAPTFFK